MRLCVLLPPLIWLLAAHHAGADDLLYQYEGDVLPYVESAGWTVYDPCEAPCSELLEEGHFMLRWSEAGDLVNYDYDIAQPPEDPPLPLGRMAISV